MVITRIEASGFRDLPRLDLADMDRVVDVLGPGPDATALADALELWFSAFSEAGLATFLRRVGCTAAELPEITVEGGLPVQATWSDSQAARHLVSDPKARALKITLEIALDPDQHVALRAASGRDPRLGVGLALAATARVGVGALFATSFDAVSLSLNELSVGGEAFPLTPENRPAWMPAFLRGLSGRFARHPAWPDAREVLLAAQSSREQHAAFRAWQEALRPFFGLVRPVRGVEGTIELYADDLPLRRFGDQAHEDALLAATVHLSGAEIVWSDRSPAWLASAVDGEGSPLEQVFSLHASGRSLDASGEPERAQPLSFPAGGR